MSEQNDDVIADLAIYDAEYNERLESYDILRKELKVEYEAMRGKRGVTNLQNALVVVTQFQIPTGRFHNFKYKRVCIEVLEKRLDTYKTAFHAVHIFHSDAPELVEKITKTTRAIQHVQDLTFE